MKDLLKAVAGLALIFVVHIPRGVFLLLLISYSAVFENRPTLTADPAEHLKRARRILGRGRLSELLYAAVEIRFALERMAQREVVWADASRRVLREHDPTKKIANLHRLAPEAAYAHEIWFVNKTTGERIKWAEYKPLERERVKTMQGRLGDLLHPKDGLLLGIPNDPWYIETKRFLNEASAYLQEVYRDNRPFFSYHGIPEFEMMRFDRGTGV
jgi:hypothetical protein